MARTCQLGDYDKSKNDTDIAIIGHITAKEERNMLVTTGGSLIPLQAQGWKHMG